MIGDLRQSREELGPHIMRWRPVSEHAFARGINGSDIDAVYPIGDAVILDDREAPRPRRKAQLDALEVAGHYPGVIPLLNYLGVTGSPPLDIYGRLAPVGPEYTGLRPKVHYHVAGMWEFGNYLVFAARYEERMALELLRDKIDYATYLLFAGDWETIFCWETLDGEEGGIGTRSFADKLKQLFKHFDLGRR